MFLSAGTILDEKYRIQGTIGSGGMGIVYEAWQPDIDRLVALKLLTYAPSEDQNELKRFEREAMALSRLSHPNIVQFHAYGKWQIYPYLAMEKLSGTSLHQFLAEYETGIDSKLALKITIEVCRALEHAHGAGIFHRDIKPSNIILTDLKDVEHPSLKVIDFGLARLTGVDGEQKLTQTGKALGSVMYMSPEQCTGAGVDARTDIYSVGCLLYECLTGTPPFLADNGVAVMFQHINEPVSKSERFDWLTPEAQAVIERCLAKKQKDRYPGAADLRADLEDLLASGAPCINRDAANRRQPRQSARLLWPGLICFLLAAFCGLAIWWQHRVADNNESSAVPGTTTGETAPIANDAFYGDPTRITSAKIADERGDLLYRQEKFDQAAKAYARADQLGDAQPDKVDVTMRFQIKQHLAQTLYRLNKFEDADRLSQQAAKLASQVPPTEQCEFFTQWTFTCFTLKHTQQGRDCAKKAVAAAEAVLKEYGENSTTNRLYTSALGRLADSYENEGQWSTAEPIRRQALAAARNQNHPDVMSMSLINLARNLNQQHKPEGLKLIEEWLDLTANLEETSDDTNYLLTKVDGQCMLGDLNQKNGQMDVALKYYQDAIATASKLKGTSHTREMAVLLSHLSAHYYKTGKTQLADKTWAEATSYLNATGDRQLVEMFTKRVEIAKRKPVVVRTNR